MSIFSEKHELPGGLHSSGLVVVAFIFLLVYWVVGHKPSASGTQSTHGENIGYGGGIIPAGWNGDYFNIPDDMQHEEHFRRVLFTREPSYHQPVVLQGGRRTKWYKVIDQFGYNHRNKPFLEKVSHP